MATKKTATTAVATRNNTNIVSITEQLNKQAEDLNSRTAPPSGNRIRVTQDKKFLLPDGTKTSDPLKLVIVDFMTVHNFYAGAFDSKDIKPPACFAIGLNPKQMVPSKNSPEVQASDCQICPMNQFGSDGDGKACKNGRLLAVLPPDATADTPMWTIAVSPTALKTFDAYVQSVSRAFQMPPVSVVTTVGFDDGVTYAKLDFSDPEPNSNLEACFARQGEARKLLETEPDVSSYERQPVKKAAGARAGSVKR